VEDVRVCRSCGHIDPVDSVGRCPDCGLFFELAIVSRPEAERLARRQRLRSTRRRLWRLLLALTLVGGITVWGMRILFDRGFNPPSATTRVSASLGPHTWGQVRRTPHNTGFTPDTAPRPHRIIWTYNTAKPLLASPAVVENRIYLTTQEGRIIALDRQTGQPVWIFQSGGPCGSTPAVAGDAVIVATRPGLVVALNRHTGALHWKTDLKYPVLASPVVVLGTVYIGAADRKLYALDAATGRQRWAFATRDWVVSAVAYAGDRVVMAAQNSLIHVVGAQTGRQRFVYDTGLGRHVLAGLAIQGKLAYFGSVGGRVWAIDWQATTYPLERMFLFWQTNLYIWGVLTTPPVQKGSVWSRYVGGDVKHTPAIAHDTVYVATSQGTVIALDATTGAKRWQANLGVEVTAAPTVAGHVVLVGTKDGVIFGLHAHTGEVLWDFKTPGKITGSPIVVRDTMYVASHDGKLYAVTGPQ
jgi:outer membrane protein assembly factor BamB